MIISLLNQADSDDGQWETDTSSDDDAVDYDLAESAPELAGQRSPMARHPQVCLNIFLIIIL